MNGTTLHIAFPKTQAEKNQNKKVHIITYENFGCWFSFNLSRKMEYFLEDSKIDSF